MKVGEIEEALWRAMKKITVVVASGVRQWERSSSERGKLREKQQWVSEIERERERDSSEAMRVPTQGERKNE